MLINKYCILTVSTLQFKKYKSKVKVKSISIWMDLKAGSVCHITTWPCCPNWHSVNETRVMAKPFCVSSMCHMSTTDVLHTKKWDCSQERCQLMNSETRWEDTDRDKKMYEYKSMARWGEAAWVERDQMELNAWIESEIYKSQRNKNS